MSIVENIQTQLDDGKYSAGVFVDLKKAFDTIDHNILLKLGQGNCVNQNNIKNHQNKTLRKITFKKFHDPANSLYNYLKIYKFKDLLHLQNCLYCKLNKIRHL